MKITCRDFENNSDMPRQYTCQGDDINPPLAIEEVPEGTVTLALICEDPDAPDPANPQMTWDHWVVWNIPSGTTEIPANWYPEKTMVGINSWGKSEYGGPCPPVGKHRYFFKLYALDIELDLPPEADKKDVLREMEGHVKDQAELIGLYEKQ